VPRKPPQFEVGDTVCPRSHRKQFAGNGNGDRAAMTSRTSIATWWGSTMVGTRSSSKENCFRYPRWN